MCVVDNQTVAHAVGLLQVLGHHGVDIFEVHAQATLQVIDVNGRILSSETINGCVSKSINATSGVYMLRLINGDNVKVQKIVVK